MVEMDRYADSDTIPSEEEYECYRAAYNDNGSFFCVDEVDGKQASAVTVSLENSKPSEKLIVPLDNNERNMLHSKEERWDLDYVDTNGRIGGISRYFEPVQMTCYNCDEKGHLKYDCPKPKKAYPCVSCGDVGHSYRDCHHSLCFNCGNPGHSKKECPMPRTQTWKPCTRCRMPGHTEQWCPDKWRQYHSTTLHGPPVQPSRDEMCDNRPIYCYNCGREGHWGFDCPEERPDDTYYIGSELVGRYDTSPCNLAIQKKRKVKGKSNENIDQPGFSDTVVSDSSAKNSTKKQRSKNYIPRSKSLASEVPAQKKHEKFKRRSKSLDDSKHEAHSKTNLSKFKSRSHKSFEKLRNFNQDAATNNDLSGGVKPKKFNKIKEEAKRLGLNKTKKRVAEKKSSGNDVSCPKQNGHHVSFKEEKKSKQGNCDEEYGYNRNKVLPNTNHANHKGGKSRHKKGWKNQEGKVEAGGQAQQTKKGKKKNKKVSGFQKTTSVF